MMNNADEGKSFKSLEDLKEAMSAVKKSNTPQLSFGGLTKREYYAGLAMQRLIIRSNYDDYESTAKMAIQYADALLKALEQKTE